MRIRTEADVDRLEKQIQSQLDIDVRKYRNDEVVETFVDLLLFPDYVISWVIRPVLFFVFLFVSGFYVLDLVHIEYFIYGVFGFGLFLSSGFSLGLMLLLDRMKTDMWGIIEHSLSIMKEASEDLSQANQNITDENRKDSLNLLFKGIIHIVTIPLLSKGISQKVPFFGGIVNLFAKRVLILISDKIEIDEDVFNKELERKDKTSNAFHDHSEALSFQVSGLEKVLNVTFRIAKYPLLFWFIFSFLTLLILIYFIN